MAPIVNEWPAPIPIVLILGFSIMGLITGLTFPTEKEQLKSEIINLNERENDENSALSYHNISQEIKFRDENHDNVTYKSTQDKSGR